MFTETTNGLGPATVLEVTDGRVRLDRSTGQAWAKLALAVPYRPEVGDVVLAIGEEEVYIIGVLSGRGKTVFEAPGDLELRAKGKIGLVSAQEVEVLAPQVTIEADKVETIARATFEKVVSCYRWVKDTIQTRAGRTRTVVDGAATLHAERVVQTAEKDVKIDGEQILLG